MAATQRSRKCRQMLAAAAALLEPHAADLLRSCYHYRTCNGWTIELRPLMAKKSKIQKNAKRIELVARYAEKRAALVSVMKDPEATSQEKREAMAELQKLPRDSSPVRIRNRCIMTGRPRGYDRKFGLSRIALREMALEGLIPGVRKSSW